MARDTFLDSHQRLLRQLLEEGVKGSSYSQRLVDTAGRLDSFLDPLDGLSVDSFGRLRISGPTNVFDAQFTYGLQPLLYDQVKLGLGSAITHDGTNRRANISLTNAAAGDLAYMQSFEYHRYQPGKSQLVFITFTMGQAVPGVAKYAVYGDGDNEVGLYLTGNGPAMSITTTTDAPSEYVPQALWNIDRLDGTGPSGKVLDLTKSQILFISFQALYVGRVIVGFDLDGVVVPVHQFIHANVIEHPYIADANLPVKVGMETAVDNANAQMSFQCAAVISEGGQEDNSSFSFFAHGSASSLGGSFVPVVSIRPRTTFLGTRNSMKFLLDSVSVLTTSSGAAQWKLTLGQWLTGESWLSVNQSHSGMEYTPTPGTADLSPDPIDFASDFVAASAQVRSSSLRALASRYPITLSATGGHRDHGTVTLLAKAATGTSTSVQGILSWREIR
jgi:hypothetical protein